jgi:cobaltochelatase CobN
MNTFILHRFLWFILLSIATLPSWGADKVALLSTKFALEHRYKLMRDIAAKQGVELAWTQVDIEGEAGVERVLSGANIVLLDAHSVSDEVLIERFAGKRLRELRVPAVSVNNALRFAAGSRATKLGMAQAQRIYEYYAGGTPTNRERLFQYLRAVIHGDDLSVLPGPEPLPNGGIYHPAYSQLVFPDLHQYLAWWEARTGKKWRDSPVIGMEISSSYISDGQTRMLDETAQALEQAGAVPLVFYRASRVGRERLATRPTGGTTPSAGADGFPNPANPPQAADLNEPLVAVNGKSILQVLLVNTFLGIDPEARKAWHQAMGIPVINVLSYRNGTRAEYMKNTAGVNSFYLPFTLTNAEYIGLQDPVVLTANDGGELVPMPEQMQMLVGKAINLAHLQTMANKDKQLALFFWNHPPGEKNQGASNLNVPRSITHLVERLKTEGYALSSTMEADVIAAVGAMLRPGYRPGTLHALMKTAHWDFLPLDVYRRWFATLPDAVRQSVDKYWGEPEKSYWIARKDGVTGFVIPRMKLGNLLVMPQPMRSESAAAGRDETKIYHDTKVPLNHFYLATYLWVREQYKANAIIHFGTHGSQEWTSGKERGLWAYDEPNLLVGNTPVVYPYIVDNIGEALHVKRRGRGVIVSHQTPAFAPAGLSDDFVRINDLIREYQSLDSGLVKDSNKKLIIEQAVRMNIHKDLGMKVADLDRDFDTFMRDIEDYLEELGATMQPLGLHTLGKDAERGHQISNVMQMLGSPLYEKTGVKNAKSAFKGDYKNLQQTRPYRFVEDYVFSNRSLDDLNDPQLQALAVRGRKFLVDLRADWEIEGISKALSARWIDPSYGGDPIRNPDALHTGRNIYGFDPSRIPTRSAFEAGKQSVEQLIAAYQLSHGKFPEKLAFTMWSTETMRHLGMLEAQILYAMGVKPRWDEGGRVVGMETIPLAQLGRPRIDVVISLTGLYRDQFPNVMERFNEAIGMLAGLNEGKEQNHIKTNTERIKATLMAKGIAPDVANRFALTRIFGNESGEYGTKLTDATLASDTWDEGDGRLEKLYLSRMSWAYGPDTANWSGKLFEAGGREINTYAEHLRGTSAAVFSRSSNLRGLLDTDHPFEYLGGISMAVKYLDGKSPQLYVSNMRDPIKAKLETAEKFLATELRSVYQHPNWMKEMQKEGYAGTLQMLNAVNNFWGWQVMDRNVVRDDQWQEFHETYVKDRYKLGMREWFEKSNPTALAQMTERMLEAIRKDFWKADEQTKRELVAVYQQVARTHDVHTSNETFKAYVKELSQGFGLGANPRQQSTATTPPPTKVSQMQSANPLPTPDVVRGQEMREVKKEQRMEQLIWTYAGLIALVVLGGIGFQAWRTRQEFGTRTPGQPL